MKVFRLLFLLILSATLSSFSFATELVQSITIAPNIVGGSNALATVTLKAPQPTATTVYVFYSGGPASVPGGFTIPANSWTGKFLFTTYPTQTDVSAGFYVYSDIASYFSQTAPRVSFTETAAKVSSFTTATSTVASGKNLTCTLVFSSLAAPSMPVTITSSSDQVTITQPTNASAVNRITFVVHALSVISATPITLTAHLNGVDTDAPSFTITPFTILRATAPATIAGGVNLPVTVVLTAPAPVGGLIVTYSSATGKLTNGAVMMNEGLSSLIVNVPTTTTLTDTASSVDFSIGGTATTVNTTVTAPTVKAVGLSPASLAGGITSKATVTLNSKAPANFSVTLTGGTSFATVPATLTFAADATFATFNVTTSAVTSVQTATIGAGGKTATLTVNPSRLSKVTVTSPYAGNHGTGTVTLTGPAPSGGITVTLSSDNTGVATPDATVTVPAGSSSATFDIATVGSTSTATATISATYGADTKSALMTVKALQLLSVSVNPTSLVGGASSTGTVTLTSPATTGGIVVNLSSDNAAGVVDATVTVLEGNLSADFTVTTSAVTTDTPVVIRAEYGASHVKATLTVTAPTPYLVSIDGPTDVYDSQILTFTVTLNRVAIDEGGGGMGGFLDSFGDVDFVTQVGYFFFFAGQQSTLAGGIKIQQGFFDTVITTEAVMVDDANNAHRVSCTSQYHATPSALEPLGDGYAVMPHEFVSLGLAPRQSPVRRSKATV